MRGQVLSLVFTNLDIITGLVYEHMIIESMVVQKLDKKNTMVVFMEGEDIEKYVIHYDPSKCHWVAVYMLDVMCDVAN